MSIKTVHGYELGTSLVYNGTTVNVQPDNTGNVQFEVTDNGFKGTVDLSQAFDPATLEASIEEAKESVGTLENTVQELTQRLLVVEAKEIPTVPSNEEILEAIKEQVVAAVLEAIKGEELQNLAGVTQGFLIKADV